MKVTPAILACWACLLVLSCERATKAPAARTAPAPPSASPPALGPDTSPPAGGPSAVARSAGGSPSPTKVEVKETAMGTALQFVAYTSPRAGEAATRAAIARAIAEMRRLEGLLSEWRDDSEVGRLNARAGEWVEVGPETFEVLERSLEAGRLSKGTFDVTFQTMSGLWKFGGAQEAEPRLPADAEVQKLRKLVDYRRLELDAKRRAARIGREQKLGLGGIAKGYIVDRAVQVLRDAGLSAFLVRAGGDLFGAGRKPDGSAWVSGIQDPRGAQGKFFAALELEDHAFSTAGDYARSYVVAGKRYHHIIDPRTGYPATACRSVTVWAGDATVADIVDDLVFILGPVEGLAVVESLAGVGAVVVDRDNRVWISKRLEGRVKILAQPSSGI